MGLRDTFADACNPLERVHDCQEAKQVVRADGLPGLLNGLCLAWAVIWILLATLASGETVHTMGYVFLGWLIGWISATIARRVYPAPTSTWIRRRRDRCRWCALLR